MASFLLRLPDEELQAIERARGPAKRLTWVRSILREACASAGEAPPPKPSRGSPRRSTADPATRRTQAKAVLDAAARVARVMPPLTSAEAKKGVEPRVRDSFR